MKILFGVLATVIALGVAVTWTVERILEHEGY